VGFFKRKKGMVVDSNYYNAGFSSSTNYICSKFSFESIYLCLILVIRYWGVDIVDFSKEYEKKSYRIGKTAGFLFSYLLFFSILFFILTKLGVKFPINYFFYILIIFAPYIIYMLIKKYAIKKVKMQ
jgi:hypothetical protein